MGKKGITEEEEEAESTFGMSDQKANSDVVRVTDYFHSEIVCSHLFR